MELAAWLEPPQKWLALLFGTGPAASEARRVAGWVLVATAVGYAYVRLRDEKVPRAELLYFQGDFARWGCVLPAPTRAARRVVAAPQHLRIYVRCACRCELK